MLWHSRHAPKKQAYSELCCSTASSSTRCSPVLLPEKHNTAVLLHHPATNKATVLGYFAKQNVAMADICLGQKAEESETTNTIDRHSSTHMRVPAQAQATAPAATPVVHTAWKDKEGTCLTNASSTHYGSNWPNLNCPDKRKNGNRHPRGNASWCETATS